MKIISRPTAARQHTALALAFALVAIGFSLSAEAQYYRGPYGGPYGPYGPYGGPYDPYDDPYGPYGPREDGPPRLPPRPIPNARNDAPPPKEKSPVRDKEAAKDKEPLKSKPTSQLEAVRQRIGAAGYKLIAAPREKGNIILAEVEDAKMMRRRLVYDAHDGRLIENTPLGVIRKPSKDADGEEARQDEHK